MSLDIPLQGTHLFTFLPDEEPCSTDTEAKQGRFKRYPYTYSLDLQLPAIGEGLRTPEEAGLVEGREGVTKGYGNWLTFHSPYSMSPALSFLPSHSYFYSLYLVQVAAEHNLQTSTVNCREQAMAQRGYLYRKIAIDVICLVIQTGLVAARPFTTRQTVDKLFRTFQQCPIQMLSRKKPPCPTFNQRSLFQLVNHPHRWYTGVILVTHWRAGGGAWRGRVCPPTRAYARSTKVVPVDKTYRSLSAVALIRICVLPAGKE
uniref:Uncharacterized protein n=1 Tax=Timema monikensis TaxID=170555 RepID=A0A7R9EBI1_9NEOP|nr:unnamed protein product [Timema monikensis]